MIEKSESIAHLADALSKAQSQMHAAKKTSDNPFFKSKYADLATVWEACKSELTNNGLSIIQLPSAEGNTVSVTTILAHNSGEWINGTITMQAKDSGPQAIGSAITYARRYGLAAIISLPQEDDDGNAATNQTSTRQGNHVNAAQNRLPEKSRSDAKKTTPLLGYDPTNTMHQSALIKALEAKNIAFIKHDEISKAMLGKSMNELDSVIESLKIGE